MFLWPKNTAGTSPDKKLIYLLWIRATNQQHRSHLWTTRAVTRASLPNAVRKVMFALARPPADTCHLQYAYSSTNPPWKDYPFLAKTLRPSKHNYSHVWTDYTRSYAKNLLTYGSQLFLRSCQLCSYLHAVRHSFWSGLWAEWAV
jgi:hypothetical protein